MIRLFCAFLALSLSVSQATAADYDFIDPGDYYYVNDWGSENRNVMVVRKLGNNRVKIRDAATGEASVIDASLLLTQDELNLEETTNAVAGTAVGVVIMVCLLSPETCQDD